MNKMNKEVVMVYKIERTRMLTDEDVKAILCTAFEGGISYWACLGNDDPEWEKEVQAIKEEGGTPYYDEVAYRVLKKGKPVYLYDEEDDDCKYELTWDKLKEGIKKYDDGLNLVHDFDIGDIDAYAADAIIQYALFNEVVYG